VIGPLGPSWVCYADSMNVGLIGFGRLGRLLARHFSRDARIFVYDVELDAKLARALGARPATMAEACAQEVVVLCVAVTIESLGHS
jgi:prephenate dehydrogenase